MRSVVLGAGISIDGYIARLDGSVDWLTPDPDYDFGAFFQTIDVAIMGRKTYDVFKTGPSLNMETYVYSRTQSAGRRDGVEFTTVSPSALVKELKAKPGKNIWLAGGGEMAREFLKEDLVDQIDLGIKPVLLGEGIPLFPPGFPQRNLKLASQKTYQSGMVTISYARQTYRIG